jgi:hypothetical protein
MYQIKDLYNSDFTRKPINAPINIHVLHQHRDQVTGVEQKKSAIKKKKRNIIARINQTLDNRKIAALAQTFLKSNNPVKYGENATNCPLS